MLKTKYSAAMWATSILALVSALGTFFALLYFNFLHAILDKWTIAVVLAGPAAAVAVLIYAAIKIFKKRENAFFIPSFLAIIGCTLVFFLADSASLLYPAGCIQKIYPLFHGDGAGTGNPASGHETVLRGRPVWKNGTL